MSSPPTAKRLHPSLAALACLSATFSFGALQAGDGPVALITSIQQLDPSGTAIVKVTRSESGLVEEGEPGTFVYSGDELETGTNTRVELTFLDEATDEKKTLFSDSDSRVAVESKSSVSLFLGRLLAQIRGRFDVYMREWQLSASGTEFQVEADGRDTPALLVLEGSVAAEQSQSSGRVPERARGGNEGKVKTLFQVANLHRLALEEGVSRRPAPTPAVEPAVRAALNWTNEMIVQRLPGISDTNSLPWFSSEEERKAVFVESRLQAVWKQDPEGYERLGEVYCDWGEGPRSVDALSRSASLDPSKMERAWFLAKLGQGFRLAGRLEQARETLERALTADPESQTAYNELGNLYLEQTKLQMRHQKAGKTIRELLQNASSAFARAAELPSKRFKPRLSQTVLLTNVDLVLAGPTGPSSIPDVEGLPRDSAIRILQEAGFVVGRIVEAKSSRAVGTVHDQDPEPGKKRPLGSTIDLEIAAPRQVKAPQMVGDDLDRARKELEAQDLVAGRITVERSCRPAGEVLRQSPEAGTRLQAGQAVDLIVAGAGENPAAVPNLFRQTVRAAQSELRRQGLQLGQIRQQETDQAPEETVLSQNPAPGILLAQGCPVDLLVARALILIPVPQLFGLAATDVRSVLGHAGLQQGSVTYPETSQYPRDTVIRQTPQAGSLVRPGTRLELLIAKLPAPPTKPVVVPDIRGLRSDVAAKRIEAAGLRLQIMNSGEYVNDCRNRRNLRGCQDQDPRPGVQVPAGTVVRVWLVIG